VKFDEIGMAGKLVTVGSNISRWATSVDSQKFYYLKNFNYSLDGNPSGTLMMADFPSGANEKQLLDKVGAYVILSDGTMMDRGLGVLQNVTSGRGDYRLIRDRNDPSMVVTVVSQVAAAITSRDSRFTMYSMNVDSQTGMGDFHIVKTDGSGGCVLNSSATNRQFGGSFLTNAGLVFWSSLNERGIREGWYASPEGCANKQKFADGIDSWYLRGDTGIIWADTSDTQARTLTLRYAPINNGNTMGPPVTIQEQADRSYVVLNRFEAVLFMVNRNSPELDGTYAYSNLAWGQ
jgi:hypothetical protein